MRLDKQIWTFPNRTLHSGVGAAPNNRSERFATKFWTNVTRTLTEGGGMVPSAPSPFTSDNVEPGSTGTTVTINANDPGDEVTAYTYEHKIGATAYVVFYRGLLTNILDTSTTNGDTVKYRVKATNAQGDSAYSTEVTVTSQDITVNAPGGGLSIGLGISL